MEYMSQECYDELVAELEHLTKVELPKAQDELAEARAKGDLSENFEYHAAKRELRRLMGQIRFKTNVFQHAQVLDPNKLDTEVVGLLRKVEFTNLANKMKMTYTIVNPHEANMMEGKISIKSPIADALLGKKVGDVVEAHVPAGVIKLRIEKISV
ncbi:MAG: transcription elongation factor GreA [Bacteroidaceae bacterium]|nr:transcription elongation factor GreA [Candidatus Minthousia equi]MCQ2247348.1 transcription elongation factor GreA [Bacteroidaceae bacterium]MDO4957603.1 transcription elongation factor GreA [Bacteroidales bacterium]